MYRFHLCLLFKVSRKVYNSSIMNLLICYVKYSFRTAFTAEHNYNLLLAKTSYLSDLAFNETLYLHKNLMLKIIDMD